jgi:PRTRC genetic system ThiF family protein
MIASRTEQCHLQTDETINVVLIGAGGNGSSMLDGLLSIHVALTTGFDLPGLQVVVVDDDTVAPHNVIRQRFYPHEVSIHKSVALCHRTNMTFGTNWQALPRRFSEKDTDLIKWADVVITAVDSLAARKAVVKASSYQQERCYKYWLDMGVDRSQGQVVLGGLKDYSMKDRLPNVVAHYPEILTAEEKHDEPSCSAAESLSRQDLFVNQTAALIASQLLWQTLRQGAFNRNGAVFDVQTGRQQPLPLAPLIPETTA